MRIFLIGPGYVGKALFTSWRGLNDRFLTTTTSESKLKDLQSLNRVESCVLLQIERHTNLEPLIDRCDVLIITVAPKQGATYKETYLDIALSVKDALKERNRSLFLLYTGSTSVYGDYEGRLVDETSERLPSSEEGKILSSVEDVFLSCESPFVEVCILRLGGIYGPQRTLEERAIKLSNKKIGGSGQELTNHIHLEDITNAIEFCTVNRLVGVYNLVNNDHPNREELYHKLCEQQQIDLPIWESKFASSRNTNALVSNQKIKRSGYIFKHPNLTSI